MPAQPGRDSRKHYTRLDCNETLTTQDTATPRIEEKEGARRTHACSMTLAKSPFGGKNGVVEALRGREE